MADQNREPGRRTTDEGVPKKAPPRETPPPKKAPPPDRQAEDNIAPGHGRRFPDKGK